MGIEVPQYEREVKTKALPSVQRKGTGYSPMSGPQARVPGAPVEAFGDGGQGLSDVGKGLSDVGGDVMAIAVDMRREDAEAQAREIDMQASERLGALMYDPENGFLARRGADASRGVGDFEQALTAERARLLEGVDDGLVSEMAGGLLDGRMQGMMETARRHAFKEHQAYVASAYEGRLTNLTDEAVRLAGADPKGFGQRMVALAQETRLYGETQGLAPEMIDAQLRERASGVHYMTALRLIEEGRPDAASAWVDRYAKSMTAEDMARVRGPLERASTTHLAMTTAAEAYAGAPAVPSGSVPMADWIVGRESAGDPTAQNPNSSAGGLGQFIDSTWLDLVKRHRPDLTAGRTDADIIALKTDPAHAGLSREMVDTYARENGERLTAAGLRATPRNLYLSHFLGAGGAVQVLRADPSASVEDVVSPAALAANKSVFYRDGNPITVDGLLTWAGHGAPDAPMTATDSPIRTAEGRYVAATQAVMARLANNPEALDMALRKLQAQHRIDKAAEEARLAEVRDQADALMQEGRSPDEFPATLRETLGVEEMNRLRGVWDASRTRRTVDEGAAFFETVMGMTPDQAAAAEDQLFAMQRNLSEADFKTLRSRIADAKKIVEGDGDESKYRLTWRDKLGNHFDLVGLRGGEFTPVRGRITADVMGALDAARERKGADLTDEEEARVVREAFAKADWEDDPPGLGNAESFEGALYEIDEIDEIPPADRTLIRREIERRLEAAGVTADDEEIEAAMVREYQRRRMLRVLP